MDDTGPRPDRLSRISRTIAESTSSPLVGRAATTRQTNPAHTLRTEYRHLFILLVTESGPETETATSPTKTPAIDPTFTRPGLGGGDDFVALLRNLAVRIANQLPAALEAARYGLRAEADRQNKEHKAGKERF